MKRLVPPALIALAATGCMHSPEALINPTEEAGKCELVQTLMRERVSQGLLSELSAQGSDGPAQVLVFVRRPEQGMLERLFQGDPTCGGPNYRAVQDITMKAVVLFLQPRGNGYIYDAQLAAPNELSLGGEAKGAVSRDGGGWVASGL
ncbi:hypothetical protein JRI60_19935 [Archangium violaceum]|uniref:hypothetical protein n=1 Tax=Archangium violaceum TaxID=83451 RepID=UPI001951F3A4|nr:hypothetical protein [Archangium violaceum]QRO01139.1 hypothetical protein JRI60_19935 [Archangium violaceum]